MIITLILCRGKLNDNIINITSMLMARVLLKMSVFLLTIQAYFLLGLCLPLLPSFFSRNRLPGSLPSLICKHFLVFEYGGRLSE